MLLDVTNVTVQPGFVLKMANIAALIWPITWIKNPGFG